MYMHIYLQTQICHHVQLFFIDVCKQTCHFVIALCSYHTHCFEMDISLFSLVYHHFSLPTLLSLCNFPFSENICIFNYLNSVDIFKQALGPVTSNAIDDEDVTTTTINSTIQGSASMRCGQGFIACVKKGCLKCSRCKMISYCSSVCQKSDWPRHRTVCRTNTKS
jgi:hypothetical protein